MSSIARARRGQTRSQRSTCTVAASFSPAVVSTGDPLLCPCAPLGVRNSAINAAQHRRMSWSGEGRRSCCHSHRSTQSDLIAQRLGDAGAGPVGQRRVKATRSAQLADVVDGVRAQAGETCNNGGPIGTSGSSRRRWSRRWIEEPGVNSHRAECVRLSASLNDQSGQGIVQICRLTSLISTRTAVPRIASFLNGDGPLPGVSAWALVF